MLIVLVALLALDLLLERNGVDRAARLQRLRERLRPAGSRDRATEPQEPPTSPHAGPTATATAPRIPFSARRPVRPARTAAPAPVDEPTPVDTTTTAPEQPAPAPTLPAAEPAGEATRPEPDAVTEVLAVEAPPAPRTRSPRTPRVTPRRAPSTRPAPSADPGSGPAPSELPVPADRDSAIDRLFAPLLESDRTEPLPTPNAGRPVRKPRDEA